MRVLAWTAILWGLISTGNYLWQSDINSALWALCSVVWAVNYLMVYNRLERNEK